jgi:hypothetical protein
LTADSSASVDWWDAADLASSRVPGTVLSTLTCPKLALKRRYPLQVRRAPRPRSLHPLLSSDQSMRFAPTGKRTTMILGSSWVRGDLSRGQATLPLRTTGHRRNHQQKQGQGFRALEVAGRISTLRIPSRLARRIRFHLHPWNCLPRHRDVRRSPTHLLPHPSRMPSDSLILVFLLEL